MTRDITNPLPTPGETGWDSDLNELLQEIIDNVEQPIAASDIDIQGDLTVNGNALTDVDHLRFSTGLDPATALTVFISGSTPEWFLRDGSNNRIQLTAGGFLNVQGSGSIGGDYPNSSAAAIYTNSTARFSFTSSPGVYADMEFGAHHIHNGSSAGAIKLQAPSGQASNITLTLPGALPAGRTVVTIDATGTLSSNDASMLLDSRGATITGTLRVVGDFTVSGSMAVTQTGSFQAVRAARDILHDNLFTLTIPGTMGTAAGGTSFINVAGRGIEMSTAGASGAFVPVPLKAGDKIDGYTGIMNKGSSSGRASWQMSVLNMTASLNQTTSIGGHCTTDAAAAIYALGSSSLDYTVGALDAVYVQFNGGGTTGDTVRGITVTYRRPTGSL